MHRRQRLCESLRAGTMRPVPSGAVAVCDDLLINRVILSRMLHQVHCRSRVYGPDPAFHVTPTTASLTPGRTQLGFTDVLCFESGCQLLQSCSLRFALVLLDLVMPYLVRALRECARCERTV